MSVTEIKQALGSWTLTLSPNTPRQILDSLTFYGHIALVPGLLDPNQYKDNLLSAARYVGVYRHRGNDDKYTLIGSGMAFWLGDDDDKGDILESPVTISGQSFANTIRALLPAGGAVTEGTLYSVAGTYTGRHQWVTPRSAITYVTDLFGAEWRVNNLGKLDAGLVSSLYVTSPKTLIVRKGIGHDLLRKAIPGDMALDVDVEDVTTRVVLLAEGEGSSIATGSANASLVPYKDIHGNVIKMTRLISESGTEAGNAAARAQVQLDKFTNPRRAVDLSTSDYDIKGDVVVGDYVDVYDPSDGFYDVNREIYWQGERINPMSLRCVEMTWPIPPGWTVAFRDIDGNWIDLTQYYQGESGDTTIVVGELARGLSTASGEPIGVRPNLPDSPGSDSTVPGVPTFTSFSSGSYQSTTNAWIKSAIQATWSTPLNIDGSAITDGDHYEIRYRVDHVLGYQTSWDDLADYTVKLSDDFKRVVSNGWGDSWAVTGTASNYSVDGEYARAIMPTVNVYQVGTNASVTASNFDMFVGPITISAAPANDNVEVGLRGRYVDANNFVDARIFYRGVSNDVICGIRQVVAGVTTATSNVTVPGATATSILWARFQAINGVLYLNVWVDGNLEPKTWTVTATTTYTTSGTFQLRCGPGPNVTNLPLTIGYGSFSFTDLAPGVDPYSWDELSSWDSLLSPIVTGGNTWQSVSVGWDSNTYSIVELTPGVTYEIQIRAVDAADPPNRGAWSASSFVTTVGDIFAPSTPAAPIVATSMVAVQVQHNLGKASGGEFNLEADLHHLDVHLSTSPYFSADDTNKIGEMIATGAMVSVGIPAVGTFKVDETDDVWVKVVAVDISGNKSAASDAAQSSIVLIDDAHISNLSVSKLTAGTITANTVLAAEMEVGLGGNIKLTDGALQVYDSGNNIKVEVGFQPDGTYDLAAVNPLDNSRVNLAQLAFGTAADSADGSTEVTAQSGGSPTYDTAPDGNGPIITDVFIGSSKKAIVFISAEMIWGNGTDTNNRVAKMSFRIKDQSTGSVTYLPGDNNALLWDTDGQGSYLIRFGTFALIPSVAFPTANGYYTFEVMYQVIGFGTGSTMYFQDRRIMVMPF